MSLEDKNTYIYKRQSDFPRRREINLVRVVECHWPQKLDAAVLLAQMRISLFCSSQVLICFGLEI